MDYSVLTLEDCIRKSLNTDQPGGGRQKTLLLLSTRFLRITYC